jgi:adenosyl cobinamide kinase/adenosyl cobinamide phosphate guanylyltransferase
MGQNILVLCADDARAAKEAASRAGAVGDSLGVVNTCMAPADVRKVGSRISETRSYGGAEVEAFDEPITVGSAVAQLAGFADAVIVDRLDDWAKRLLAYYADKEGTEDRIVEEIAGVTTVMNADLAELVLVSRPVQGTGPEAELHSRILEAVREHLTEVVEL